MLDGLLPDDSSENQNEDLADIRTLAAARIRVDHVPKITYRELKMAVVRQNNRRAPGKDGIRAEIVKRAFSRVSGLLLNIVNEIFRGHIPRGMEGWGA